MSKLSRREIDKLWKISKETKEEDWISQEDADRILKKKHSNSKFSILKR